MNKATAKYTFPPRNMIKGKYANYYIPQSDYVLMGGLRLSPPYHWTHTQKHFKSGSGTIETTKNVSNYISLYGNRVNTKVRLFSAHTTMLQDYDYPSGSEN